LAMSYIMAIPFFKWTVLGDVLYTVLFIAIIEGVKAVSLSAGHSRRADGLSPLINN